MRPFNDPEGTRPRQLDPARTFDGLVQWIHDELLVSRQAPGFIIGLSGTDSALSFIVVAEALARQDKVHRLIGVHFASDPLNVSPATAELLGC